MAKRGLMLLLVGMGLVLVQGGSAPTAPVPGPPPLDPTRPEAWPLAVAGHQEGLDQLARALIAVAEDDEQPGEARKQAIFALGQINNRRSLSFLLDHLDYRVSRWKNPGEIRALHDDQQAKRSPCQYALYRYSDWNIVPLILEQLDQLKSEGQLGTYSGLLDKHLSGEGTAAIIAAELSKQPEGARKQNLQTLKGWYQQHHHFLRNLKEPSSSIPQLGRAIAEPK